jgi:signal transduction histidine kinase/CheY-like chemotaxis protein
MNDKMRTRDVVKKNLRSIIFVVVTFGLMASISYASLRVMLRQQLLYSAKKEMGAIETNIRLKLSETQITLVNAVIVIARTIETGGSNEDILDYFITISERMKEKRGRRAALNFKGLYGYINGEYLDGTLWDPLDPVSGFLDTNGNLLPFVPQERVWYTTALKAENNAVVFTRPYIDLATKTHIVSVSAKVEVAGKIAGVVSTDVDIDSLKKYVREIEFSKGGYGMLLDKNLNIVAHRDRHLINTNMRNAGEGYASIAQRLTADKNQPKTGIADTDKTNAAVFFHRMFDIDGTDVIAFFHRLSNSGAYIGVITPVRSYYSNLAHTAATLAILGLIFSAVLIFLLIKFSAAKMIADAKDRSKSTFLATMSHEIRTPMNAIIGIAQIQLQQENLPKEYEEGLGRIYNSASGLLGIINDILDLSKIEMGKLELNLAEYDVPSFINDTVQINIVRIGSKDIEFIVEPDSALPSRLYGDELRLKQILNNLLSNAIKYTDKGHVKLSISHSVTGEDVLLRFSVEDTGQGFTPSDKAKLFSEYQRFNASANRSTEGTGLGLSITKSLVALMDGKIEVESVHGKGSVFTVEVAQKSVPCEPIGAEVSENLKKFSFKMKSGNWQGTRHIMPYGKVLIVDDVDTNLYVAQGLLAPYRLNIETANSGFAAIDLVEKGKVYDIIFMDHMMPQMDGVETVRRLRTLGYDGKIVALTANALTGNAEMFKQRGFDGFISKPINTRYMDAVLNEFVRDRYPEEAKKYKAVNVETNSVRSPAINPVVQKIFRNDAEKAVITLRETIKNGDMNLFAITAHAMKSALANIGESEKSQLAAKLEKAGLDGDSDYINANAEIFIKILEELAQTISAAAETANENDTAISEDTAYLAQQLEIIKSACEDYNDAAVFQALDLLKKKKWKKETAAVLENIYELVYALSDFEAAAERAQDLIGG